MLAAVWLATQQSARWQLRLRALSQYERKYFASITVHLHSLPHTNLVNVTHDATTPKAALEDPEVFEEQSLADYTIVAQTLVPPPPSILSIIEDRLPKLLCHPLPGDAIFEASTDPDYAAAAPMHDAHNPLSATDSLSALVEAGNYGDAFNVLTDIQNAGLSIPFSHKYEKAAQAVLMDSHLGPSEIESRFSSWFSLIPPKHEAGRNRKFLRTRNLVLNLSPENPRIVSEMSLVLASKGYAFYIAPEAIPFVLRFTSPDFGLQFITALEAADAAYWKGYASSNRLFKKMTKLSRSKIRSAAVRTLVYSGHMEEALKLLPSSQGQFCLTTRTCDILLTALHRQPKVDLNRVRHIAYIRSNALPTKEEQDVDPDLSQIDSLLLALDPKSQEYVGNDLVGPLRALVEAFQKRRALPALSLIVACIDECLGKSQTAVVANLRRTALDSRAKWATHFLLAEMLYYNSRGLDDLLLKLFADHYYLSGVPRKEIIDYSRRPLDGDSTSAYEIQSVFDEQSQAMFLHRWHDTPSSRANIVKLLKLGKCNEFRRKLWPTHAHRNLVWSSLVRLAPSRDAVERLYSQLLKFASRKETDLDHSTKTSLSFLRPPESEARLVDTEAFTPFLSRILSEVNPDRGAQILSDIQRVGIIPSIQHFTQVAGSYARMGNVRHAFAILDVLEGHHPPEDHPSPGPIRSPRDPADKVPRPDLPIYASLMQGFLMSNNVADAQEVEARLTRRFAYTPGRHLPLDRALTQLRQFEHETQAHLSPLLQKHSKEDAS